MSQIVTCPHCRQGVQSQSGLAGRQVTCPHCSNAFLMPISGALLPPQQPPSAMAQVVQPSAPVAWQPQQAPSSQPIFINTAPRTEKRLQASGWFSRAFGSTMGVILAIMAVVGVAVLITCGGCLLITGAGTAAINSVAEESLKQRQENTATAKKMALPALKKHGVSEISSDASFLDVLGDRQLIGKARTTDGKLVPFAVSFEIAEFGKTKQWQINSIVLDGERVFERK